MAFVALPHDGSCEACIKYERLGKQHEQDNKCCGDTKAAAAYQPSSYRAPTKRVAVAVSSNHAQHTTISHRSSTERRLIHNSASAPPASTMIKPPSEEARLWFK